MDESVRRNWFNPDKVLKNIGVHPGMVFADVGCGDGFFTILAAEVLGEKGVVYAVDRDGSAIARLKRKATKKGLGNVKAVVAEAEETVFCDRCVDVVFYSIVLHDFRDPAKVLRNAKRMLKPDGLLVDLDWKKKQIEHGPPFRIRFSEEEAQTMIETAGFRVESVTDAGSNHYLVMAKPKP